MVWKESSLEVPEMLQKVSHNIAALQGGAPRNFSWRSHVPVTGRLGGHIS